MERDWSYRGYRIRDGLKPGSPHFQYFYVVTEKETKKSNYCIWIVDAALAGFDPSRDFDSIAASQREQWDSWVRGKIDAGDFGNKVLKYEEDGKREIELSEMTKHLSMG